MSRYPLIKVHEPRMSGTLVWLIVREMFLQQRKASINKEQIDLTNQLILILLFREEVDS